MSLPTFSVNFGGTFETLADGVVRYNDGLTQILECKAIDLFVSLEREIPVPMYKQRIWFKLPYETLADLRFIWTGGDNFAKLCEVVQWIKVIDIYMETDDSVQIPPSTKEPIPNPHHNTEADEPIPNPDNNTEADEPIRCKEEERVEAVIDEIQDDSELEGLPSTPICSDNEDNGPQYERFKKGSGELKMLQVFTSVEEFKEGVLEYALKGGWNVKYAKWGPVKLEGVCGSEGKPPCLWRIYCSFDKRTDAWLVKTFNDKHTCIKDGRCKILTDNMIAKMFVNDIRNNPSLQPKQMQQKIEEKYNLVATYDQLKKSRMKALKIIQSEYDAQYSRIKDYANEIRSSNPGSTVHLNTVMIDGPLEILEKFYVCYEALRSSWLQCSRKVIGIDGCFMKNGTKAQLLAVVGRDGNNGVYPIAWAMVQIEDEPNWCWFISKIRDDLQLGTGRGTTLISDRQKGLLNAVDRILPDVEHRMCARHVYGNMCRQHPRRGRFKKLFWDVVHNYTQVDYQTCLQRLRDYDVAVYEAFIQRNPRFCSRAFFNTHTVCEDALNNNSESYNSTLEKARAMPLVEMLETMRRQAMVRIEMRRVKAMNCKSMFCPRVGKLIKGEEEHKKYCRTIPGPTGMFEVVEHANAFTVNMTRRTCTCRRWDLTGVPCRHSLRVIMDKKLNVEDFVSSHFLTSTWQKQYSYNISPMVGMKFWIPSGEPTLQAPVREVKKGRARKPETRVKEVTECEKKGKKASSHARLMFCQRCGGEGHYKRGCKNPGALKKPKKWTEPEEECFTMDEGEGPSQPTQEN